MIKPSQIELVLASGVQCKQVQICWNVALADHAGVLVDIEWLAVRAAPVKRRWAIADGVDERKAAEMCTECNLEHEVSYRTCVAAAVELQS